MSENQLRAVVFDMDGLMFNTEHLYDQSGQTLLARRGMTFSRELKLAMMGLPGPDAFAVMIDACGLTETVEELQAETDEIFRELLPAKIEKMPGLDALLETIEQQSIPKAIATSSHRKFARAALDRFDLQPRFEFVLTAENVRRGKPNPEIYLTAAERLGVSPDEVLVLEDSVAGSRAAANAGCFTVAVPTEYSVGLDYSHADLVVSSLEHPAIAEIVRSGNL